MVIFDVSHEAEFKPYLQRIFLWLRNKNMDQIERRKQHLKINQKLAMENVAA
jgi:hypothetical protein